MNPIKFWTAAIAVVMGILFTSCNEDKGNGAQPISRYIIAKVSKTLPRYEFTTLDGYTMSTMTQQPGISGTEAGVGDLVYIAYSYNMDDANLTNKYINIWLYGIENIDGNPVASLPSKSDQGYAANRAVQAIKITGSDSFQSVVPFMYDDNKLILPIFYYAKEDLSKHRFTIVYYEDELEKSELILYLRHVSSETESDETKTGFSYRAFNIASALYAYYSKNGRYPDQINIYADINTSGASMPASPTVTPIPYSHK